MHDRSGRLLFGCSTAAMLLFAGITAAAQDGQAMRFSGYFKNQLSRSTTLFPAGQRYDADLSRLRLQVQGQLTPRLGFEVQYDNELLLGNYVRTQQFALQKEMRSPQFWRLDSDYADSSNAHARHRLYRGFVMLSAGETDVRVGRQRIAWGTGRFWSPLDLLNPISPIQLEREERPGVDALLVERKLGELSRVSAVFAPQHKRGDSSTALYWHGNTAGVDVSVVAGKFTGNKLIGADVATQVGQAGLRGEATYTIPRTGKNYRRLLLGVDYAFANTLTLGAEFYHNGAGASTESAYDFPALLNGRILSLGRRYAGLFASYEITPLMKTQHYIVGNIQDGSRYYSPSLTYSVRTNLDWTTGAQLFSGNAQREFGRMKNLYYTQLQWYF